MTDSTPEFLSVVIPTFNRADDLHRALSSLVAQTFQDFEVIVSDDGSTDHTTSIVDSFTDLLRVTYLKGPNSGLPSVARNRALSRCVGDYVAFLDSDDWWTPRKLEVCVKWARLGYDVIYHDLKIAPRSSLLDSRRVVSRQVKPSGGTSLVRRGNVIPLSSAVVRRKVVELAGGFSTDPTYRAWEDFDLWIRLETSGSSFKRIPKSLGYYWRGQGNISAPSALIEQLGHVESKLLIDQTNRPPWFNFGMGHALYQVGRRQDSRGFLFKAMTSTGQHRRRADRWKAAALLLASVIPPQSHL
ncbi:MAG: glycosyltransferase family 2 protein [Actinobacteria bacterium]|nr:glycosyltransferase family 2 protein [Actinomycetota bacterium]